MLSPLVDFLFKRLFGDEKNTDLLIHFLNAVFDESGGPVITSVEILNPYLDKDALSDKMSILDIKARTQDHALVNVEIQIRNERNIRERTLYYWAKLYEGQLTEGTSYRDLNRTITVNLLNFVDVANERYHNVYRIREDIDGSLLTDRLEIHLLELPKLQNQGIPVDRRLVRWLSFLSARTRERMEELVRGDAVMEKAMTTLEFLSQDRQTRILYEERQKGLHDYVSAIEDATEKGKLEGKLEMARSLLAKGLGIEMIEEASGLAREQIEALRQDLH
ncbi:MAG: Rpn family recombination-promoting nuclease/putative transposase [Bacilli bacterium]